MIVNNINFCYVFICVEAVDSLFLEILKRPAFLIPKCQFSLPQLLKSLRYPFTLDRQRPSSFPQSHTQQAKAVNYIMQVNGETRTDWGNQQIKDSNPVSYFLLSAPPPPPLTLLSPFGSEHLVSSPLGARKSRKITLPLPYLQEHKRYDNETWRVDSNV